MPLKAALALATMLVLAGCMQRGPSGPPDGDENSPAHVAWEIDWACKAKQHDLQKFATPHAAVPDANTAIARADPIFRSVFGDDYLEHESPLVALRHDDKWLVKGTLPKGPGGAAMLVMSQTTGEIVCLTHGQ